MRIRKNGRELSLLAMLILGLSFLSVVTFPKAHALTPSVNTTCQNSNVLTSSLTCIMTVANVGDIIAMSFVYSTNTANTISSVTSITGGNTTFSRIIADANPGFVSGGNTFWMGSEIWSGTAGASGAQTYTISWNAAPNTVAIAGEDMLNVSPTPVSFDTGHCSNPTNCSQTITTAHLNPFTSGQALEIGALVASQQIGAAGTGYTKLTQNPETQASAEYSTTASSVTSPTNFPMQTNVACGVGCTWSDVGVIFGSGTVTTTSTTTINTGCMGSCSGGNNGTSQYSGTVFTLHFYASTNLLSSAQVDNVTLKIAAVHINTATGTLYIVCYGATGQPSGGNPYALILSQALTISNGTSNFFVHSNPQCNLASGQFYAVGYMTTTTASRGSGATGSGISFYESSQVGTIEYKYNVGSNTPPNSFFSSTQQTPRDFIYVHTIFTVATFTVTSVSTVSGTVSSTVFVTSTNIINQLNMASSGFWFIPLVFLLAPMGLLIAVKRIADGRS